MSRKIKSPQRVLGVLLTLMMVMALVPTVSVERSINFHVSTNGVCTRGQMVTFLYRLLGK